MPDISVMVSTVTMPMNVAVITHVAITLFALITRVAMTPVMMDSLDPVMNVLTSTNVIMVFNSCAENVSGENYVGSCTYECLNDYNGDGFECTNIDECAMSPCDENVSCKDTLGSFGNDSFDGDGFISVDVNDCTTLDSRRTW